MLFKMIKKLMWIKNEEAIRFLKTIARYEVFYRKHNAKNVDFGKAVEESDVQLDV